MLYRLVAVAVMATVCGSFASHAQSVADLGGPANLPPAGFQGQQYVDNRGCVFLKAGYGGQTTWVPRVTRDRKALCGYPPSFGRQPVIEMAEETAPAPMPAPAPAMPAAAAKPAAKPAPVVVATAAPVGKAPAPYATQPPVKSYETVAGTSVPAGKIGCYTSAPVAERVRLSGGGSAVVCTRGDGTMDGWRPPVYPKGAPVGASLSEPPVVVARGNSRAADLGESYAAAPRATAENPTPVVPEGYKMAWDDGRLNPNRGKGTAQGWAEQDQIWTRDTPAQLVVTAKKKPLPVASQSGSASVTASTKGAASGKIYVQVGMFGVASNADGAAGRLKAAGLPTARAKLTQKGKPMQSVLAGPFASTAEAQAALVIARRAGFGDAYIR